MALERAPADRTGTIGVEAFDATYGAGFQASDDPPHAVECKLVEDGAAFVAHRPAAADRPRRVAVVDGTLRTEARLTRTDDDGDVSMGVGGSLGRASPASRCRQASAAPRRSRRRRGRLAGWGVQAFPEGIALAQDAIAEVIALSAHPTVRASRARRASPRFPAIMGPMLDTHTVARSLTNAGCTPAQADAITNALRLVVERGDLDAGAVAQSLTEVKFTPAQADAITNAINLAAEHRRRPRS